MARRIGLLWAFTIVVLEAVQAVFFGGVFQHRDAFLVGAIVFGSTAIAALGWTAWLEPDQLRTAWRARSSLVGLNVSTALVWVAYFYALQMIEPAAVFALFSGIVPLAILVASRMGVPEAEPLHTSVERLGMGVITLSLILLGCATLLGWSGFVRGGLAVAVAGLGLSILSSASLAAMMLYGRQLDRLGVAPVAQYGLRFPLYVVVAAGAAWLGLDAKPAAGAGEGDALGPSLPVVILVGLAVIAFPVLAMQKAIALLPPMPLALVTALGPLVVFGLQVVEGRVDYAPAVMAGLIIYFVGALLAASGTVRKARGQAMPSRNDSGSERTG